MSQVNKKTKSKSRNGCLTCKKKRLKCDETKPECFNCVNKGISCGGYATNFKWKSFEDIQKKKSSPPTTHNNSINQVNNGQTISIISNEKVKMKRSMSVPDSLKFEEAFRQATLSIAGKTSAELAIHSNLLQQGINPNPNPTRSNSSSSNSRPTSYMPLISEGSPNTPIPPSPSLSTIIKAFTDYQNNIPSPSNLDLASPASISNLISGSAIDDDDNFMPSEQQLINNTLIPMRRNLSMDSSLSNMSLPQYRRELLSPNSNSPFIRKLEIPQQISSTPMDLLKTINLSVDDFNSLFDTFNNYTSNIMSIKDGPNDNPWRKLIFPLSLQYPVLFKAVASMSMSHLLQVNKDDRLLKLSHDYMRSSMNELAEGLTNNSIPNDVALATCLVLAITDGWKSDGKSSGIIHLKGARSIMKKLTPGEIKGNVERYQFLINSFIYFDVMCRLSNVGITGETFDENILTTADDLNERTMKTPQREDSASTAGSVDSYLDPMINENFLLSKKLTKNNLIDPSLGISKSLFLIISKVASFISKVRKLSKLSLSDISTAVKLKTEVEQWKPDPSLIKESLFQDESDQKDIDLSSCIATAEAYRFSTLLYLQQVVPEISSQRSSNLADKVLMLLASIPTSSKTLILHIFPMLVASCEIEDLDDREWILERWNVLNEKLWLSNVSQAVEIIKEVWRRKEVKKSKGKPEKPGKIQDIPGDIGDWELFQGKIDTLVGSKNRNEEGINDWTHWSTVMQDWKLELLFVTRGSNKDDLDMKGKKNGNKLKFKRQKKTKSSHVRKEEQIKEKLDQYYEDSSNNKADIKTTESLKEDIIDNNMEKQSSPDKPNLNEWGPSINGYRFIDTGETTKKYYQQRHNLAYGSSSSNLTDPTFEWSYEELPKFTFSGYDYLDEKYSVRGESDNEWNYDSYLEYWKKVRNNELDDVVLRFPIFTNKELTMANVEEFLKSSKTEPLLTILKRERIRWHPDKMFQLLPNVENGDFLKFQELIKVSFQCINEVWEKHR